MATKTKSKAGQLLWRRGGWSGRYRTLKDGEWIRLCVPLGTDNKSVARVKLDRLIAGDAKPETVSEPETFEQAARRVVPLQGVKTAAERLRRLEMYAFPRLGQLHVTVLRGADIREVLDQAVSEGLSRTTVGHVLDDISGILDSLWRYEILKENPAKRVEVPKAAKVDDRPRVVLTDEEFSTLIDAPGLDLELRLMALTARCFGGMRTSDLHAWDWSHIDVKAWGDAYVPRPKTQTRDRLALPEMIVPALRQWWVAAGRPVAGPVFPERMRERAGERRGKRSHARRLRAALWAAGVKRGETKATCELQTDTAETKRVDFHSFRRAFNTALAGAGVNVQTAMKLAGHRNASTHMRYVRLTEATAMPEAALPRAPSVPTVNPEDPDMISQLLETTKRPQRDLNPCYRRERAKTSAQGSVNAQFYDTLRSGVSDEDGSVPKARAQAADAALVAYLRVLATDSARGLS